MAHRIRVNALRAGGLAILLGSLAAALPAGAVAQTTLRIVAYNIRHGEGMDGRVDLERVAAALRPLDADVIALQEVDRGTRRTGGVDQAARLGELLGMRASHGAHRPYQGGEYGNAVLTRLPVLDVRTLPVPPNGGSALAVHEVVLPVGGRPLSVVSVHLAGAPEERRAQADSVTGTFGGVERTVILAGDFNSTRGDAVLAGLEGTWRIPPKEGDSSTYPADDPDREIDFVMFRPPGAMEILEHRVVDEPVASDHRPVLMVVRIW